MVSKWIIIQKDGRFASIFTPSKYPVITGSNGSKVWYDARFSPCKKLVSLTSDFYGTNLLASCAVDGELKEIPNIDGKFSTWYIFRNCCPRLAHRYDNTYGISCHSYFHTPSRLEKYIIIAFFAIFLTVTLSILFILH